MRWWKTFPQAELVKAVLSSHAVFKQADVVQPEHFETQLRGSKCCKIRPAYKLSVNQGELSETGVAFDV